MRCRVIAMTLVLAFSSGASFAAEHSGSHHHVKRRKLVHAAGWAGAGAAAGRLAGPAGSAAVGAAKYRHDLKKNWHTRRRAIRKIGAPIAAGAVAGPVGTAGYEAYDHRKWIKRHLVPGRHHRVHRGHQRR